MIWSSVHIYILLSSKNNKVFSFFSFFLGGPCPKSVTGARESPRDEDTQSKAPSVW